MMLTCVTTYSLCWLPLNIYNILRDIPGALANVTDDEHFKLFFAIHWLAMAHTCFNPIIYCWMNQKFRLAYMKVFSCCCKNNIELSRVNTYPHRYLSNQARSELVTELRPKLSTETPTRYSCYQYCYCLCCTGKDRSPSPEIEFELNHRLMNLSQVVVR